MSRTNEQAVRQQHFVQAVIDDADEAVEAAVHTLLPEDEPWLLAMLSDSPPDNDEPDQLTAKRPDYQWWVVRALAFCGGDACVPAVIGTLGDSDASVRAVALLALAHLHVRAPQAVEPALADMAWLLADNDGAVRQTATDALSMVGDAAVDALADVLAVDNPAGENEGARSRATAALRKIGSMAAAGVLFRYLNDPNYLVRSYAYEALDEMGLLETQLLIL